VRYFIFFIILCSFFTGAHAYNHPEIQWKSVATKHFIIHYYDKTEPALYASWKIAEEAFDALAPLYSYPGNEKINLALADYDDYSNGWADWTSRSIMIWIADSRFDLRGNPTWLRNVITHEVSHILSLEKKRGTQLLDWTLGMQYTSPTFAMDLVAPIPLTYFFPAWFAEGTAQLGAQALGNDCWDSRRDMLLRCAILDKKELSLDEMANFTHTGIGNEMVYNQGYSFSRFLENSVGRECMARIWKEGRQRKFGSLNFTSFFKEISRQSLEQLHTNWRDSLHIAYSQMLPGNPTAVTPIWSGGLFNRLPRVSADGKYWGWLTSERDDGYRTDLIIAPYGSTEPIVRVRWAKQSWDFGADSKSIYYLKSRTPDMNGSFLNDLYTCNLESKDERRLTHGARLYDVAAARSGSEIYCVKYLKGAFALTRFSTKTNTFSTESDGVIGAPFVAPGVSPRSVDSLVVGRIIDGNADVYLYDRASHALSLVVGSIAQEESPFWAPNGRIYFSADYDGIFNIYSITPGDSILRRHTSVVGGAFSPWVDSRGNLLAVEYVASGFRIAQCSLDSGTVYTPDRNELCVFKPLPKPAGKVTVNPKTYRPKLLRAIYELSSFATIDDTAGAMSDIFTGKGSDHFLEKSSVEINSSLVAYRADAVGKRARAMGLAGMFMPMMIDKADTNSANRQLQSSTRVAFDSNILWAKIRTRIRSDVRLPSLNFAAASIRRADRGVAAATAPTTDTSSGKTYLPQVLLAPFIQMQNSARQMTLGFSGQTYLNYLLIPVIFDLAPSLQWHCARDLMCGFSPEIMLYTAAFIKNQPLYFTTFPFWVQWQRTGYYNEDVDYNLADVTQVEAFTAFQTAPLEMRRFDDTTYTTARMVNSALQARHGIPVRRYASIGIRTDDYLQSVSATINDPKGLLNNASTFFAQINAGVDFTFPIVRNINRGRLYADNLYGTVLYDWTLYGNKDGFSSRSAHPSDTPDDIAVFHTVGARIDLGLISSYTFMRHLALAGGWEFGGRGGFFSFSLAH
jgi:hypothetical protein